MKGKGGRQTADGGRRTADGRKFLLLFSYTPAQPVFAVFVYLHYSTRADKYNLFLGGLNWAVL